MGEDLNTPTPADLLRQASERAAKVLPLPVVPAVVNWLCHEADEVEYWTPDQLDLPDAAGHMSARDFARAVLALSSSDRELTAAVDAVAHELGDFRLRLGPNTLEAIRQGQDHVYLTGGEREDIARAVLAVVRPSITAEQANTIYMSIWQREHNANHSVTPEQIAEEFRAAGIEVTG